MPVLPLCVTALIGGFVAYLASAFDRGQHLLRLTNYPVGVAAASLATWISQNVPRMHNKLLILSVFVPAIALLLYQSVRHLVESKRREARPDRLNRF